MSRVFFDENESMHSGGEMGISSEEIISSEWVERQ